jgi:hypothetical protein
MGALGILCGCPHLAEDAGCTVVCARSPTAALKLHFSDRILAAEGTEWSLTWTWTKDN